jgi:glycosyltransferase involved in cell wall biosynthesis
LVGPGDVLRRILTPEAILRVLVLIPARNEAASLPAVIRTLRTDQPGIEILVVDDASSDNSLELLPALGVQWLSLCEHLGVGGALRAGLRYAALLRCDVVVRIDGDGQHPARQIDRVLAPILNGAADAVVGSRYRGPASYQTPAARRVVQRLVAAWLSAATGQRVTDATSGFWVFGPRAIRLLATHHPAGYPEPELLMLLSRNGLRIAEVPIEMNRRMAGRTSLTAGRMGLAFARTALALLIAPLRGTAGGAGGE